MRAACFTSGQRSRGLFSRHPKDELNEVADAFLAEHAAAFFHESRDNFLLPFRIMSRHPA
jgi:hypothetical protein